MPQINNPYLSHSVTRPRGRLVINDIPVATLVSASVTTANHRSADTMSARIVIGYNLALPTLPGDPNFPPAWWGTDAPKSAIVSVELSVTDASRPEGVNAWVPVFVGTIDHCHVELFSGVVDITARDLSSRFIDAKTREVFKNQTSSDVIKTLAGRRGLGADVTPTATPVGRIYQLEHDRITLDSSASTTTEWALMMRLAQEEGYDLWVDPRTRKVNFHPYVKLDDTNANVFLVHAEAATPVRPYPVSNAKDLRIDRNFALAKDIVVVVKSWDGRKAQSVHARYPGNAKAGATEYVIVRGGLDPAKATALAQDTWRDLVAHELLADFEIVGETVMDARTLVRITGTGTAWDTLLYVNTITRNITFEGALTQSVTVKNQSPQGAILTGA